MELTDIHNRHDNIKVVSDDCKANNYPLIAWPEDKELLRLADLPQFVTANKRNTWTGLKFYASHIITSDEHLRDVIQPGFAYARNVLTDNHIKATIVDEYTIETQSVGVLDKLFIAKVKKESTRALDLFENVYHYRRKDIRLRIK